MNGWMYKTDASEKLLPPTGSSAWCSVMTWGGIGGGMEVQEGGDIMYAYS